VCAQGVNNKVADAAYPTNAYKYASGTSFSCPLTAGVVAILLQAHPDWTPAMVKESLVSTASQNDMPNISYGWGIIDTIAAIKYSPRRGNCTNFTCSGHGCCIARACNCSPEYYGVACDVGRVACSDLICNARGGVCQKQPNTLTFRCGYEPDIADAIYPVCPECAFDVCGVCFGSNQCVAGCDGIPFSNATYDACGVCNGNNQTCLYRFVLSTYYSL